jgi:hypothetical protein
MQVWQFWTLIAVLILIAADRNYRLRKFADAIDDLRAALLQARDERKRLEESMWRGFDTLEHRIANPRRQ